LVSETKTGGSGLWVCTAYPFHDPFFVLLAGPFIIRLTVSSGMVDKAEVCFSAKKGFISRRGVAVVDRVLLVLVLVGLVLLAIFNSSTTAALCAD